VRTSLFEPRYADGQLGKFAAFAAELCRLGVIVIVALGAVATRAAQKQTTDIAIIFAGVIDPIGAGFATTWEQPGGNLTGITSFDPQQPKLQLEVLKEVIPTVARVANLNDRDSPRAADGSLNPLEKANETAAHELALRSLMVRVKGPGPISKRLSHS
jgi:ABC-type uncharacterized transport system substrate-binding protein